MACVLVLSLAGLGALAQPAEAAERLTERELDTVTAGAVEAHARARALAVGSQARTITGSEAVTGRQRLQSVTTRKLKTGRAIVDTVAERQVEYGYASASALAEGRSAAVDCGVDLRFTTRPAIRLKSMRFDNGPAMASCNCATFGISALPN